MSQNKIPIKEAYKRLDISKATLYNRLKVLGIKPQKEGKNSYLSNDDLDKLMEFNPAKDRKDTLDKEVKILKKSLKEKERKVELLNREVGLWQGRAKTLEELNEKLLMLEAPKQKVGFFKKIRNIFTK